LRLSKIKFPRFHSYYMFKLFITSPTPLTWEISPYTHQICLKKKDFQIPTHYREFTGQSVLNGVSRSIHVKELHCRFRERKKKKHCSPYKRQNFRTYSFSILFQCQSKVVATIVLFLYKWNNGKLHFTIEPLSSYLIMNIININ
jgi:hypothetical protein